MTVPVGGGPPAGGVSVATSVTAVPGGTVVLLVEAAVVRVTGQGGDGEPLGGDAAADRGGDRGVEAVA